MQIIGIFLQKYEKKSRKPQIPPEIYLTENTGNRLMRCQGEGMSGEELGDIAAVVFKFAHDA